MTVTDFDETQHPRDPSGQFTNKPASESTADLPDDPSARAHHAAGTYADADSARAAATTATGLGLYAAVTVRSEHPDDTSEEVSDQDFTVVVMDTEREVADYLEAESLEPSDADNAAAPDPWVDPSTGTRTEYATRIHRPAQPRSTPAPRVQVDAADLRENDLVEINGVGQRVTHVDTDESRTLVSTGTAAHNFGPDQRATVLADAEFLQNRSQDTYRRADEASRVVHEAQRTVHDSAVATLAMDVKAFYPTARHVEITDSDAGGQTFTVTDAEGRALHDYEGEGPDRDRANDTFGEAAALMRFDNATYLHEHAADHDPGHMGWGYSGRIEVDKYTGHVDSITIDVDAAIARELAARQVS